jgi:hypothetical protein
MNIFNTTPYVFFPYDTSVAPTLPSLTLIVRGTFSVRHGLPAVVKPKAAQKSLRGDEQHMDDLGRSLCYSTDLVPMKPRGEVLVYATCHTPEAQPRPSHEVSITVGPIHKTLHVTGPRVFVEGLLGRVAPGRTAPFTVMPIRWELAFGGVSFPLNPLGRGIDPIPDDNGTPIPYLPCIEYPSSRMSEPKDRPVPAGLGPIAPSWLSRSKLQGTRDQRWAMFRAPLPPKDFDPGFYNAAPADQQLKKGYFKGNEPVVLTGLHREHQRYETALPGKRVRAFALVDNPEEHEKDPNEPEKKFVEVPMNLDTVHLDVQKGEMVLLWRGQAEVTSPQFEEIEACYVTEEDVADRPAMVEEHHAAFVALTTPKPRAAAPAPEVAAPPDAGEKAEEEKLDANINAAMAQITKVLKDSKVDPKVVAQVEQTRDPEAIFKLLEGHARELIRNMETMAANLKGG